MLTDVPGLRVGNAEDLALRSGVTVVLFDAPATASISVLGGAPALRDTMLLDPGMSVQKIDAIVLSGGSVHGLDATRGVLPILAPLAARRPAGEIRVPIVVQAGLFDLGNGGDKDWGAENPYPALAASATHAAGADFALGTAGAGTGAVTATLRGGLGSASTVTEEGYRVGALMVVNAIGTATIGDGPHFWSAPFEAGAEFGGLGFPARLTADDLRLRVKPNLVKGSSDGTTIGVVATDAALSKAQARRLAIAGQDGVARAVLPAHLPRDGDAVFGAATGHAAPPDDQAFDGILQAAAIVTARAIALGVHRAAPTGWDSCPPSWQERFGNGRFGNGRFGAAS